MITPFDIEKKEFSKGVRGYNIEEVDDFLDEIADQVSELIRENFALKNELQAAQEAASQQVVVEKEAPAAINDQG
jgi:cell division initiation protein